MRSYLQTPSSHSPSQHSSKLGTALFRSLSLALAIAAVGASTASSAQAQAELVAPPTPAAAAAQAGVSASASGQTAASTQAKITTVAAPLASSSSPLTVATTTATGEKPIVVNIDGRVSTPDPAPLLEGGAVFVPLRGVLENLGAKVNYAPADKRIDIQQNGKTYTLRPGISGATIGTEIVPLAAAKVVGGRAYVPLRSLAELFGYRVAWLNAQRTVAIYTSDSLKPAVVDHRAELAAGGPFGVEIDVVGATDEEIAMLLDAARDSGAGLVKVRFDWGTLQPERDSEFQWLHFDSVVRGARERGLKMVGVLGNSAQWASVALSPETDAWRNSPPKEKEFPAWTNYVTRVVGRYKVDVQAWQIWENPSAANFRSVARNYRKLARLAIDAARVADPKAVVHAAEPGGVELDFINDLTSNGLTPLLDGVQVFPVSQWQPGVPNPAESFLLPYATLREKLQLTDGKKRDYWLGGISTPVFEPKTLEGSEVSLSDNQKSLLRTYSPAGQADYLVRMFSLALAGGADKVFWNPLRDSQVPQVGSDGAVTGGIGLLRADGTPRPSYEALKLLSKNIKGKPYAGNLGLDSNVIALLFDDKKSGTLVAWSPTGGATLTLNSAGHNPELEGATFVATRPDSKVLDATGKEIAPPDGIIKLNNRPILITNVALGTAAAAAPRLEDGSLRLKTIGSSYAKADEVKATFAETGGEDGLFWRSYANFGGMAQKIEQWGNRFGLTTQAQRDILDLKSSKPFIYLDVADDFMYFTGGTPITLTVDVRRPAPGSANSISSFRIEYDSPTGYKTTPLQVVEPGEGWVTYTYNIPDASFANAEGYDLLINTGGSKTDLTFGSVSVRRAAPLGENNVS